MFKGQWSNALGPLTLDEVTTNGLTAGQQKLSDTTISQMKSSQIHCLQSLKFFRKKLISSSADVTDELQILTTK
jgi:hypothetical protein